MAEFVVVVSVLVVLLVVIFVADVFVEVVFVVVFVFVAFTISIVVVFVALRIPSAPLVVVAPVRVVVCSPSVVLPPLSWKYSSSSSSSIGI